MPSQDVIVSSNLKKAVGFRKFLRPSQLTIGLLDGGYHLHREAYQALKKLGHRCIRIPVDHCSSRNNLQAVLEGIITHKVDFILLINHIGFDAEGRMGSLLEELDIPIACWYCDSPFFVLRDGSVPAPKVSSFFIWERDLIPTLKELGAQEVHHLPLAADTDLFSVAKDIQKGEYVSLGFVADSMVSNIDIWRKKLAKQYWNDAAAVSRALQDSRKNMAPKMLAQLREEPTKPVWDILALGTYQATQAYRKDVADTLSPHGLVVFGDKGWKQVLPSARFSKPVHYGEALAQLYSKTKISLNATSLQMPTAVNQRVFDVPVAGGFLLSDAQEDLEDFFELGKEAIVYHCKEELLDLYHFFRDKDSVRAKITIAAQLRIERNHTYRHRLKKLCEKMGIRHRRSPKKAELESSSGI